MKVEEREAAGEFMAKQHYCGVDPEREAVWEAAKAFYVEARTVPADVREAVEVVCQLERDAEEWPVSDAVRNAFRAGCERMAEHLIAAVSGDEQKEQAG